MKNGIKIKKKNLYILGFILIIFLSLLVTTQIEEENVCKYSTFSKECEDSEGKSLRVFGNKFWNGTHEVDLSREIISDTSTKYDYKSESTPYDAYFMDDIQEGKANIFSFENFNISYDLSGGKMQWSGDKNIGSIQSSIANVSGNQITYHDAFKDGNTDVRYTLDKDQQKEEFILHSLPSHKSGDGEYLEYIGDLEFSDNLDIWANGEKQDGKEFNTTGRIELKNSTNHTHFYLPEPTAIDSKGNEGNLIYYIKPNEGKLTFTLKIPFSYLNSSSRVYPIKIDPSLNIEDENTILGGDKEYSTVFVGNNGTLKVNQSTNFLNLTASQNFTNYGTITGIDCLQGGNASSRDGEGESPGLRGDGGGGGGAGHASFGGNGGTSTTNGGDAIGNKSDRFNLTKGSGGGHGDSSGSGSGGNGGNGACAIKIKSRDIFSNGTFEFSGGAGGNGDDKNDGSSHGDGGGGGSAGNIILEGADINISNSIININGGGGGNGDGNVNDPADGGGGGSGGFLKVFYKTTFFNSSTSLSLSGGTGGGAGGTETGGDNPTPGENGGDGLTYYEQNDDLFDSILPTSSFGTNPIDNLNTSNQSLTFDIRATDNLNDNFEIAIYGNWTGNWIKNYTNSSYTNNTFLNITFNNIPEGIHKWAVYSQDNSNNEDFTDINRTLTVDATGPNITIVKPENKNYFDETNISLNYTSIDKFVDADSCWFKIVNETGDLIIDNQTLANCDNSTFSVPGGDIDYNLTLYSNDTLSNTNSEIREFGIRTQSPAISLDNPTDETIFESGENVSFRFTATDEDGIDQCDLFSDFDGNWGINETFNNVSSGVQIETIKDLSDGDYLWNVRCNDTLGNSDFALDNFTLTIGTPTEVIGGGGGGGVTQVSTFSESTNLSLTTTNFQDQLDLIIPTSSSRPREVNIQIVNSGQEPSNVRLECQRNQDNESSIGVNLCNYINFTETNFTVIANENQPYQTSFTLESPPETELGDEYFVNLFVFDDENGVFDDLSIKAETTLSANIFRWGDTITFGAFDYPILGISILFSLIVFIGSIALFIGGLKKPITGGIISFSLLGITFFLTLFFFP